MNERANNFIIKKFSNAVNVDKPVYLHTVSLLKPLSGPKMNENKQKIVISKFFPYSSNSKVYQQSNSKTIIK